MGVAAALVLLVGGSIAFASQALNHPADPDAVTVGAPPPPPLTLLPPGSAITRSATVDLTAVAPANLRVDQAYVVRIFVNDKPVGRMDMPGQAQFTVRGVPLDEGTNVIRTTLVGDGGESAPSAAVSMTRDDVAPEITVLEPTNKVYTETETLIGTTEAGADMHITDAAGHDIESSVQASGRFSADLDLHVGSNELTLRSTDAAGNRSNARVTIVRASSAATIDLTVTPTAIYRADLPAPVRLSVTARDELGRSVADGTEVVFGVSPPDRETTTYRATTTKGRATLSGITVNPGETSGTWLVTALVTLPSGIELRNAASFSLLENGRKSPAPH